MIPGQRCQRQMVGLKFEGGLCVRWSLTVVVYMIVLMLVGVGFCALTAHRTVVENYTVEV